MEALLEKKKQIEGLLMVIESQIKIQEMTIGNEIKKSNEKLKKNKKSFNEFLKESNEIKKCYICEKIYIEEKKEYEIPGFKNFELTHIFQKEGEVLCVNKNEKEMVIRILKKEKERMIMLSEKYFEDFEEKYNEIRNGDKEKNSYEKNKEINEYNMNNLGSKQWNNEWGESSKNNKWDEEVNNQWENKETSDKWDKQKNMKNWNENFENFCNEIDDMNENRKKEYENEWTEVQSRNMRKRFNGNKFNYNNYNNKKKI
jgi:hypothetical protein